MPIINSDFKPGLSKINNGHFDTLYPYFLRKVPVVHFTRERIETADKDFLDLDWQQFGHKKLLILSHGLESSSDATYIRAMIHLFNKDGYDALSWNSRSCSGVMNLKHIFYHSGASYDLDTVIEHVLAQNKYDEIYLMGFSMGANITLKYLAEKSHNINPFIKKAMAISAPVDLESASFRLATGFSNLYGQNFLKTLRKKIHLKKDQLLDFGIDYKNLKNVKTLMDFDHYFTAPIHGFSDAFDYYKKCSSLPILHQIQIPTLILNALNDPFLGKTCFPYKEAQANPNLFLEATERGGHVGFLDTGLNQLFWSEIRAKNFLQSL